MPTSVKELLNFLDNNFPQDHPYAKVKAEPIPEISPTPWLLGTSKKSAVLAGENGLDYNFGQFMSDSDGVQIIQQYKDAFISRNEKQKPEASLTVSVVCAETTEKAKEIALSTQIWSIQKGRGEGNEGVPSIEDAKRFLLTAEETEVIEKMNRKMIIGNPKEVSKRLYEIHENYKVDEIMIVTITHSPEDRLNSYKLIATELLGYSG
ncbi:luciferase family oxidoreductase group 1 [Bacillus luteolus]|nr:luciferase family oxidoreductase group 1 [Cytobacillus luteolus]